MLAAAEDGVLVPIQCEYLALEGITRPVKGALSIAIEAAKNRDLQGLVVPRESAGEAAIVEDLDVIAIDSLAQAVAFFAGEIDLAVLDVVMPKLGGRTVASIIRMGKVETPDEWTQMSVQDIQFDQDHADSLFTLSNLRNPRQ